ncbi:unknown [Bacteroides sp. CAG:702]|nr:unknown [Bacteroides sp. CAG:702]
MNYERPEFSDRFFVLSGETIYFTLRSITKRY